ncbi:hypothetical protein HIM_11744 [Hirsutella minnesotensis 3608]|uniref:DUF7492 domain-containing protein n=1 Tax=Hirsutella minnesotensis 3608 TaxID=1043627 RepID=A0A0F7ZR23_9HYPO|nr:hypothetical protein HIM_11744 [Hirsutella minnesotensis 3608]
MARQWDRLGTLVEPYRVKIHPSMICKCSISLPMEEVSTSNYASSLPSLQAWAGAFIALRYQENGQVALPELSPHKRSSGSVFIYGTTQSSNDNLLDSIHQVWNEDGTGGDRRGRLIVAEALTTGNATRSIKAPYLGNGRKSTPKPPQTLKVLTSGVRMTFNCRMTLVLDTVFIGSGIGRLSQIALLRKDRWSARDGSRNKPVQHGVLYHVQHHQVVRRVLQGVRHDQGNPGHGPHQGEVADRQQNRLDHQLP